MSHLVEIEKLSKRFGDFEAVVDLSLAVEAGEIVALLGPNGAGKTTTIRMLMGILQPSSGSASILGHDCFAQREHAMMHVGYVPDDPVFYDYLTGEEILRFVADMRGVDRADAMRRFEPLVRELELDDALGEFAANYSKGMKKKLSLVCALMHEPRLLILDEPSSGLDPFANRIFQSLIRARAEAGAAVFYSTHLLDQAERLCDRIAILFKGRLAALGRLGDLRERMREGGSLEDIFFHVASEPVGGAEAEAEARAEPETETMSASETLRASEPDAEHGDSAAPLNR